MDTTINFNRLPERKFIFKRINILLGTNGTGKSKLLTELKGKANHFFPDRTVIYVEGGRTIKIVDTLELTRNNFQQYGTLETANTTFKNKRTSTLSDRVTDALLLLDRMGQEIRSNHSDAVHEWNKAGKMGPMPNREPPPLTKLFTLFSEIFPSIQLQLNPNSKLLTCTKNGSTPYPPSQLSDGEKQVLSILADIAILGDEKSIILVDEPELNLNPSLACRVWDTIENDLPECIFVYSTHNVGFAMRGNVDNILVLSNTENNISEIENISDINTNDIREFLGSIPAILSTANALITEGRESSLDSIFYRWIIERSDIEIVPMDSSSDVQAVVNRLGVWGKIAPSVKILGVIDRDFKSDESIKKITTGNCILLKYHEAESYYCIPELVVSASEKMGLIDKPPTINEVKTAIINEFRPLMLGIAAQRVFDIAKLNLSVSISKSELIGIGTKEELETKLIEESKKQHAYAEDVLSEGKIKDLLKIEIDACELALANEDIDKMLELMPAKNLHGKISKMTGARNPSDYARACAKHLNIDDYPALKELKGKLSFE